MMKIKMLVAFDDGVAVGDDDGQVRFMPFDTFESWTRAGYESQAMKVEYIELEERSVPITAHRDGDEITLNEWTFATTPNRVTAGYSQNTKTWVVGKRTLPAF